MLILLAGSALGAVLGIAFVVMDGSI